MRDGEGVAVDRAPAGGGAGKTAVAIWEEVENGEAGEAAAGGVGGVGG